MENDDRMYISKFDPVEKRNDDEYRIYFFITDEGIQIVRRFVMYSSKYKENIDTNNKFYIEAESILNTYYERYKKNHEKVS
ncbi:hypothetical protein [Bacillus thuringiensis]|uniref:hypothetical protein n=1 Tax=Bacillus thuringiensis TaxID=1428 RepID=UPI0021D66645|nr:hypothetical protein [Bacillus thuringiensis]MCU7666904.1 hypothetical protein [Bacillus thuringiensis]